MSGALELQLDAVIGTKLAEMWAGLLLDPVPQMLLEALAKLPIEPETLVDFILFNFSPALIYTVGTVVSGGVFCVIVSLAYLLKTVLGIDLFDEPSALHYLFFD